jgi:hypothetical protein
MACATEAHLYLRDLNRSPFNVGTRVTLADFTNEQVEEINRRHDGVLKSPEDMARFLDLTGGHPYLVRRGLLELAAGGLSLDSLAPRMGAADGPFADHLRRLGCLVAADHDLAAAAREALAGRACEEASFLRLRTAGVLAGDSAARPRLRCRIYADYLRERL